MTVEAASYVGQLVATNPAGTDDRNEGDNHLRLLKQVLLATFPNLNGAATMTAAELNLLVGLTGTIRTSLSTPLAGEMVLMSAVTVRTGSSAITATATRRCQRT